MPSAVNLHRVVATKGLQAFVEPDAVANWLPPFSFTTCYLGWQESLSKLPKLLEPEINQ
jgi:hypothetical protein